MRKINYLFVQLLLMVIIPKLFSQSYSWTNQNSNTNIDLSSVFFANENIGWIVGDNGLILKTIDGGNEWITLISNTSNDLMSVFFVNDQIGWAVGTLGLIMKTIDGGSSWVIQNSDVTNGLWSVHFFNEYIGGAVGENGESLRTSNGGDTWLKAYSGIDYRLRSVFYTTENVAWAVSSNKIYRSLNGGSSWQQEASVQNQLNFVHFFNEQIGWIVGEQGMILKTINGGVSWQYLESGTSIDLIEVNFINDYLGWAVGKDGLIIKTSDGGKTWSIQNALSSKYLTSVYYISDVKGWIVGEDGTIFKYTSYAPRLPINPSILGKDGSITISWSANIDQDISHYRLFRGTSTGNLTLIIDNITDTTYTDNTVDNGTMYYYAVSAVDLDGYESEKSSEVSATPLNWYENEIVAYYDFNQDVNNRISDNHHGQPTSISFVSDANRNGNYSAFFDGSSSFIDFNSSLGNFGTEDFSISLMTRVSTSSNHRVIFSRERIGDEWNQFRLALGIDNIYPDDNEKLYFFTRFSSGELPWTAPNGNTVETDEALSLNQWHHVIVKREGNQIHFYLDGNQVASDYLSGNLDINNDLNFRLGANYNQSGSGASSFLSGEIDEVRLFNRALSNDEVVLAYHQDAPPQPPTNLTLELVEGGVRLIWNNSPSFDLRRYLIKRGTSVDNMQTIHTLSFSRIISAFGKNSDSKFSINNVVSIDTTWIDTSIKTGFTYYYSIVAQDVDMFESINSNFQQVGYNSTITASLQKSLAIQGDTLTIQFEVGSEIPVEYLYGIRWIVDWDKDAVTYLSGSAQAGDFIANSESFFRKLTDRNAIDMAITATSGTGVSGSGVLATARFIATQYDTVRFTFSGITAQDSAGNSMVMNVKPLDLVILPPYPDAPVVSNTKALENAVHISWEPSNQEFVTAYRVYAGTVSGLLDSLTTVLVTDFTEQNPFLVHDSLVAGVEYFYQITALHYGGLESERSPEVSVRPFGLVAWLPLNGTSDDSVRALTPTGLFTNFTSGRLPKEEKRAADINGEHLLFPSAINRNSSFTLSAWVNPRSSNSLHTILFERDENGMDECGTGSAGNFGLQIYNGKWSFEISTTDDEGCLPTQLRPDTVLPQIGKWAFVTAVFDTTTTQADLYINGVLVASETVKKNLRTHPDATLRIGRNSNSAPQPFDGFLQDLRIYDMALSAERIKTLFVEGGWPAPEKIEKPEIIAGDRSLSLTMSLPNEKDADAEFFKIYRGLSAENLFVTDTLDISVTQKMFTDLPNGVRQFVAVSVVDSSGLESELSEIATEIPFGIIAWYPFNGNVNDSLGLHNGSEIGSVEYIANWDGSSIQLNGTDSYVEVPHHSAFATESSLSILVWVKTDFTTEEKYIVSKGQETPYTLGLKDGKFWFKVGQNAESQLNLFSSSAPDGNWHLLLATWNGSTARLAIDGVQEAFGEFTLPLQDSSDPIRFGVRSVNPAGYLAAEIDEIKLFNSIISVDSARVWYENYRNEALAVNLSAWYHLDGTARDTSGNERHGTVIGATNTSDRFESHEKALSFNGVDHYVDLPGNFSIGTGLVSVNIWAKSLFDQTDAYGNIVFISDQNGGNNWLQIQFKKAEQQIIFGLKSGGNSSQSEVILPVSSIKDSQWHMVTGVRETQTKLKLYLDGFAVDSVENVNLSNVNLGETTLHYLGKNNDGVQDYYFQGELDDYRFWNRALSPSEISDLFYSGGWSLARITEVNPNYAIPGMEILITGQGFGETQETGSLYFGSTQVSEIGFWSDDTIRVIVPEMEASQSPITLVNASGRQISFDTFSIKAPIAIWPGDTNNDGTVNGADLLPIGRFYNQTAIGYPEGTVWQEFLRLPWPADGNNPNRIYADANGDGEINEDDIPMLTIHYDKVVGTADEPELLKESKSIDSVNVIVEILPTENGYTFDFAVDSESISTQIRSISGRINAKQTFNTASAELISLNSEWVDPIGLIKVNHNLSRVDFGYGSTKWVTQNQQTLIKIHVLVPDENKSIENWTISRLNLYDNAGNRIPLKMKDKEETSTSIEEAQLPVKFAMYQNYPNPFNPNTQVKFDLPENAFVSLTLYDIHGRVISKLVLRDFSAGSHTVQVDAKQWSSGLYFYRIQAESRSTKAVFQQTRKMMLIK